MEDPKERKKRFPKPSSFRRRRRKFPEYKTQSTPVITKTPAQPLSIKKVLEQRPGIIPVLIVETTLYLRNQGLVSIEGLTEIPGIEKIEHLKLENNKLSNVDADHFKGLNLHSIDLSCNSIEELPDNFFDISLKVLNLSDNPLSEAQKAKIKEQCPDSITLIL